MGQALTKKKPSASKTASKPTGFECTFCGKVLQREISLIKHLCKKKKRYLERERQDVRFGYIAYRIFYDISYPTRRKAVSQEHFRESSVYDAFVRFGKYVVDVNAIAPEEFIRFAVQSKRSIDKWCSDSLYMEYVRLLNRVESYDRAIERTLLLAESWANKEGRELKNFFREIAPALAVQWIVSGRISPWVLFNSDSGKELLGKFSDEQFDLLQKAIDMKFWGKKFLDNIDDCHSIQAFLQSEGI
jgi:hypothetical protein